MSGRQLRHFAKTKTKHLPHSKSCGLIRMKEAAKLIVNELLSEDGPRDDDDEQGEIYAAKTILGALNRLQASLPQASPEQQHDITIIRSSANNLIRMHGA